MRKKENLFLWLIVKGNNNVHLSVYIEFDFGKFYNSI